MLRLVQMPYGSMCNDSSRIMRVRLITSIAYMWSGTSSNVSGPLVVKLVRGSVACVRKRGCLMIYDDNDHSRPVCPADSTRRILDCVIIGVAQRFLQCRCSSLLSTRVARSGSGRASIKLLRLSTSKSRGMNGRSIDGKEWNENRRLASGRREERRGEVDKVSGTLSQTKRDDYYCDWQYVTCRYCFISKTEFLRVCPMDCNLRESRLRKRAPVGHLSPSPRQLRARYLELIIVAVLTVIDRLTRGKRKEKTVQDAWEAEDWAVKTLTRGL